MPQGIDDALGCNAFLESLAKDLRELGESLAGVIRGESAFGGGQAASDGFFPRELSKMDRSSGEDQADKYGGDQAGRNRMTPDPFAAPLQQRRLAPFGIQRLVLEPMVELIGQVGGGTGSALEVRFQATPADGIQVGIDLRVEGGRRAEVSLAGPLHEVNPIVRGKRSLATDQTVEDRAKAVDIARGR